MGAPPVAFLEHLQFVDASARAVPAQGDREPAESLRCADAVAVGELGPTVQVDIHVVEDHVDITGHDAVEVAGPRQVGGLHDGNDHALFPRYR